jgi:hypothetical protein
LANAALKNDMENIAIDFTLNSPGSDLIVANENGDATPDFRVLKN